MFNNFCKKQAIDFNDVRSVLLHWFAAFVAHLRWAWTWIEFHIPSQDQQVSEIDWGSPHHLDIASVGWLLVGCLGRLLFALYGTEPLKLVPLTGSLRPRCSGVLLRSVNDESLRRSCCFPPLPWPIFLKLIQIIIKNYQNDKFKEDQNVQGQ